MFEWLITRPMGYIIQFIYNLVSNYGLAIILFTIIIKLILLPLNVKSQKSMKKTQKIQPILAELQEKYANDKEKLQRETMKLYKENNVSMTGGCLPMLIQLPILIGLYQVIQKPLTYILNIDWSTAADEVIRLRDAVVGMGQNIGNLANAGVDTIQSTGQIQLSNWAGIVGGGTHPWGINFNFLGLNLSYAPSEGLTELMNGNFANISIILLLLIPVLAVAASFASMKISQIQSGQNNNSQANQSAKVMTFIGPVMTLIFTFTLPAGLGLYWIISSAVQIVQQIALNYYLDRKKGDDFVVKIPEKKHNHGKKRKK